ncbi:MAG: MoaD/ThiS family protein [Syntrophorhabdales bacterium]|jgi:sulfur carrier protein ThiS
MEVAVKLFGNLGHYLPKGGNRFSLSKALDDGATVEDLLRSLDIPGEVPVIVIVNGRRVEGFHVLSDGDEVNLFRPIGGG